MKDFDTTETAVLVIDVQRGIYETTPPPRDEQSVLENINRIAAAARASAAPVIFLQHDGAPDEQWLAPFTDEWKLHSALRVESGDCIIRKTACDGFYRTELDGYLRSKNVETLIVTGYATDFCVDTTIRSAASRDYGVIVVSDGHTTKGRPVLTAEQIKAHHEWMWLNLICPKGVSLAHSYELVRGFTGTT